MSSPRRYRIRRPCLWRSSPPAPAHAERGLAAAYALDAVHRGLASTRELEVLYYAAIPSTRTLLIAAAGTEPTRTRGRCPFPLPYLPLPVNSSLCAFSTHRAAVHAHGSRARRSLLVGGARGLTVYGRRSACGVWWGLTRDDSDGTVQRFEVRCGERRDGGDAGSGDRGGRAPWSGVVVGRRRPGRPRATKVLGWLTSDGRVRAYVYGCGCEHLRAGDAGLGAEEVRAARRRGAERRAPATMRSVARRGAPRPSVGRVLLRVPEDTRTQSHECIHCMGDARAGFALSQPRLSMTPGCATILVLSCVRRVRRFRRAPSGVRLSRWGSAATTGCDEYRSVSWPRMGCCAS
ncbi:hypothetical protein B0H15DRAFT_155817 [Mycena belliarum]|uniref:Uncharacterized protein n=1 Tax=Mycena belliarum TaxID=1033014 RepID=A0AAD6XWN3_9AGAR|nr:hypothetical protein B0H15DRAFT_155817 [Mycena belliae]